MFGNALNVWDTQSRFLRQRIELLELDGQFPICVRFLHNPELMHAFAVTAVGSAVFHLHKNSVSGQ